jgi:hypothetical protein
VKKYAILVILISFSIIDIGLSAQESDTQLRRWADAGNVTAQYNLAVRASKKNRDRQAFRWMKRSADGDFKRAQFQLARFYSEGKGTTIDHSKAAKWYLKAAEAEFEEAYYEIAIAYSRGIGIEKDLDRAYGWFVASAEAGNSKAKYEIYLMYKNSSIKTKSVLGENWLRKAAADGYGPAEKTLADSEKIYNEIAVSTVTENRSTKNSEEDIDVKAPSSTDLDPVLADREKDTANNGKYPLLDNKALFEVQSKLLEHGYLSVQPNGIWDLATESAVDRLITDTGTSYRFSSEAKKFLKFIDQSFIESDTSCGPVTQELKSKQGRWVACFVLDI